MLSNGSNVRARPSDAIALAIHTGAMIEASTEVIEEAGVELPDGTHLLLTESLRRKRCPRSAARLLAGWTHGLSPARSTKFRIG